MCYFTASNYGCGSDFSVVLFVELCKDLQELYFSCTSPNLVTMSIKHCQIANNVLVCSYIHVYIMTNFMDLWLFLPH